MDTGGKKDRQMKWVVSPWVNLCYVLKDGSTAG